MNKIKNNLVKHMEMFCMECGSRHCGSNGEKKAADYIEDEFKKIGYEVIREEYSTLGWNLKKFSLYNVTKGRVVPCSTAAYFSPSSDVEDNLLFINCMDIEDLEKIDIKDKFCFVSATRIKEGLNALSERMDKLGAKAAIFISSGDHTSLKPSTKMPRSPMVENMGVCSVSQEGAYDIARNPDDVYKLIIESEKFDHISYNIIARHVGKSGKKGVVGAHYDTAPGIQGALDNASGTSVLIELARLYKEKLNDDISIDFCAFSAEEYIIDVCPPGSGNYIKRHKNEDIKWYLNIDNAGPLIYDKILQVSHFNKLDIRIKSNAFYDNVLGSDDKAFSLAGIPTVWLKVRTPFCEMHTELDNLDIVSYEHMEKDTKEYLHILNQLVEKNI